LTKSRGTQKQRRHKLAPDRALAEHKKRVKRRAKKKWQREQANRDFNRVVQQHGAVSIAY